MKHRDLGVLPGLCSRSSLLLACALLPLGSCSPSFEEHCVRARETMAPLFDPYGDRCLADGECSTRQCIHQPGVCSCEVDRDCSSGLCLSGMCANPAHDSQLTPGLAAPDRPLQTLCSNMEDQPGAASAVACTRVRALLLDSRCPDSCQALSLRICACFTGGALFSCLDRLASDRAAGGLPSAEEQDACTEALEEFSCMHYKGPPGAACGRPETCTCSGGSCGTATVCTGSRECISGICSDTVPENNLGSPGDHPLDWQCRQACSEDLDCPLHWRCDPLSPLGDGRFLCRPRPDGAAL